MPVLPVTPVPPLVQVTPLVLVLRRLRRSGAAAHSGRPWAGSPGGSTGPRAPQALTRAEHQGRVGWTRCAIPSGEEGAGA